MEDLKIFYNVKKLSFKKIISLLLVSFELGVE